jgi:hypothetical protein
MKPLRQDPVRSSELNKILRPSGGNGWPGDEVWFAWNVLLI